MIATCHQTGGDVSIFWLPSFFLTNHTHMLHFPTLCIDSSVFRPECRESVIERKNRMSMGWQLQGLWKNPDFMKVWLSRTISNLGNGITGIALPVIAVQVLNATPAQMSILSALNGMAVLLFGLLAGVWIDRLRRR